MPDRQALLFGQTLDERFAEYHARNPLVFKLFERFARTALQSGRTHYSAKAIMERVRWEISIKSQDDQGFKINNNYTSRYARLLATEYPEFKGFFHMRELRAA